MECETDIHSNAGQNGQLTSPAGRSEMGCLSLVFESWTLFCQLSGGGGGGGHDGEAIVQSLWPAGLMGCLNSHLLASACLGVYLQ